MGLKYAKKYFLYNREESDGIKVLHGMDERCGVKAIIQKEKNTSENDSLNILLFFILISNFCSCLFYLNPMFLSERINRGKSRTGYRADPFAGVKMMLHQNIPDRLVDIAEREDEKKRCMEIKVREIYEWQNHYIHKRNLKDRSKCRIACGTVGIVLRPVSHTDDRRHTVDDQHTGTDLIGFTGKPQGM